MNKNRGLKKFTPFDLLICVIVGVFSITCIYPFLLVIMGSLSTQETIIKDGFTLFPKHMTIDAYKTLLMNGNYIVSAYKITITVTIVGTFLSLLFNSLMAFPLSRRSLKYRKFMNLIVLIPLLFAGGMVPWYIVCVRYLQLKDTLWAMILPAVVTSFNIYLFRNYFYSIPDSLYEAAKIDGASDFYVFFRIYFSLSTSVYATLGLFAALYYWNDWYLGLMLIYKTELQPLQLFLRNIVANIQFLMKMNPSPEVMSMMNGLPRDGMRMAVVVITIGPIIFLYPFIQKYFVKGIMIGAVKG
jgi:putative aldouronate transport system permease protein